MKLIKFRICEFRSVEDSGWIEVGDLATMVGANESGKTNLLLALWKLNSAGECPVNPVLDMPRHKYYSLIGAPVKPVFVTGCFALDREERALLRGAEYGDRVGCVYIGRDYNDALHVEFAETADDDDAVGTLLAQCRAAETELATAKLSDVELLADLKTTLARAVAELTRPTEADFGSTVSRIAALLGKFSSVDPTELPAVAGLLATVNAKTKLVALSLRADLAQAVASRMPRFVYYASCGNLDGEIDLERAVIDYTRTDLRGNELQRRRITNKFLDLLGIPPRQLLALGQQLLAALADPARHDEFLALKQRSEEIMNAAEERFNAAFDAWYGGCNFSFDFKLDGAFVRVRVCDEDGFEPIELEFRSEWLQWMFSFCLVLIGSGALDRPAILLLDEPEAALHPVAQVELYRLLGQKSKTMQIVFCTHSPFLVDGTRLDRIIKVFNDERGYTVTGEDLRVGSRDAQIEADFAVSSAVRLMISDRLLESGIPVLTESVPDQIYLSAYKNLLAGLGELRTRRELVVIPCGGVDGVKAVLPTLVGRNNFLPVVVLDETPALAADLTERCSVFRAHPARVIVPEKYRLADYAPRKVTVVMFAAYMKDLGYPVSDMPLGDRSRPIEEIIAAEIASHHYTVPSDWRTELASRVRNEIIRYGARLWSRDGAKLDALKTLFGRIVTL